MVMTQLHNHGYEVFQSSNNNLKTGVYQFNIVFYQSSSARLIMESACMVKKEYEVIVSRQKNFFSFYPFN
jgi:hypothetical protein